MTFTKGGRLEKEAKLLAEEGRHNEASKKYLEAADAHLALSQKALIVAFACVCIAIISQLIGLIV